MEYKKIDNKFFVRIDPDANVIENLKILCEKENIKTAAVTGIGSAKFIKLGFFNPATKQYQEKDYNGYYEIANLVGNITEKDGKGFPHIHITASSEDFKLFGGHLVEVKVSVTAEIVVELTSGGVKKVLNDKLGLSIFTF
ncbi:MAG: DUF296 domain-containing protein [Rickettsiales bacterium]|jgi:predicted DNA-binding protein with PD1-like motif|nr:DUF296 domain-containing protein [Rickettsiales bacterium]